MYAPSRPFIQIFPNLIHKKKNMLLFSLTLKNSSLSAFRKLKPHEELLEKSEY